jgi:hypothetical protein
VPLDLCDEKLMQLNERKHPVGKADSTGLFPLSHIKIQNDMLPISYIH